MFSMNAKAESCKPHCINCVGAHAANNPTCPPLAGGARVATLRAASPTPLSRRVVKAAVREESREVRSYAAAVKANLLETTTVDPSLLHSTPALRRTLLPQASSPRSSLPAASRAKPSEDPQDIPIANLLAAVQVVGDYLPLDHPMRVFCLPPVSAWPGTSQDE
ncbi:hypothetical protein MTO96_032187 [Rhipicephalus appendiculatus]